MSKEPNILNQSSAKPSRSVLFGAAFLMATSAIGPGFLTQTSTFTAQHGAVSYTHLHCTHILCKRSPGNFPLKIPENRKLSIS